MSVVARGAGSLHLSPGTLDVLGYDPEPVASPRDALAAFTAARPDHPYGALAAHLDDAIAWFREAVPGMRLEGGLDRNMLLPSAVGVPRPTALAPASIAAGDLARHPAAGGGGPAPAQGLLPAAARREPLAQRAARRRGGGGAPDRSGRSRPGPGRADVGGPVYARAFDEPDFRARVADALRVRIEADEHVALPAVVGLRRGGRGMGRPARAARRAGRRDPDAAARRYRGCACSTSCSTRSPRRAGGWCWGPTAVGVRVGGRPPDGDRGARRGARARHPGRRRRAGDRRLLRRRPGARLATAHCARPCSASR